jgi:hypothetical protein
MKTLFFFFLLTLSITLNAQITKGNWLVGGDIAFSYSKSKSQSINDSESFIIDASPNVGYFFWDKLAFGTRVNYFRSRFESSSGNSELDSFLVSPFVRYYFLNEKKRTNPFLESSYRFSLEDENKAEEFSFKGGIAVFLNSSVAVEISLNYLNSNSKNQFVGSHTILLGFGIQVHLEKL